MIGVFTPATGQVIGSIRAYGENSGTTYTVFRVDLTTGNSTALGSGNVNSAINFADVTGTLNDYFLVRFDSASPLETIFGVHLNGPDVVFADPFNNAAHWSFTAGANNGAVGWAVDSSPTTLLGSAAFQSAPFSLNYNNGVSFDSGSGVVNNGAATSSLGLIDLSGTTSPTLTFLCNYQTETTSTSFDKRFVEFSNNGFSSTLLSAQLAGSGQTGGINACSTTFGAWHTHTLPLQASWGNVQMRFRFDTVDGTVNAGAGWFIDDVMISAAAGASTPGAPVGRITPDQITNNND